MELKEAKTILVTFLMQLGDLVLTTPFLSVLRKSAPDAKITYLIDEKWYDIVSCNPDIDEVLTIDRKGRDNSFTALWRYTSILKEHNFDYLININASERCSFLAAFSGAKYKTGITHSLFSLKFDRVLQLNRILHTADMYVDVLQQLGADDLSNEGLKIIPPQRCIEEAERFFAGMAGDRLIGFNIGSASATKKWMPERFAQVADHVANKGFIPVFFGSGAERPDVEETVGKMKNKAVIATGEFSIGELTAAIRKMKLFVTNDSGPMHIAVSQKVPIVALYGPSKPELYGPYTKDAIIVKAVPPCDGCKDRMKHKCNDMSCMENITAAQVNEAVDRIIKEQIS